MVPPHSQIWGEIVTLLVKILKLYQLVEVEASKFSCSFCLWISSLHYLLLSDLETEDIGCLSVHGRKKLDLRFPIRSIEILVTTLPKALDKGILWIGDCLEEN